MSDIDYRELLLKYIAHVIGCEGSDFIDHIGSSEGYGVPFDDVEVEKLKQLSAVGLQEYNS